MPLPSRPSFPFGSRTTRRQSRESNRASAPQGSQPGVRTPTTKATGRREKPLRVRIGLLLGTSQAQPHGVSVGRSSGDARQRSRRIAGPANSVVQGIKPATLRYDNSAGLRHANISLIKGGDRVCGILYRIATISSTWSNARPLGKSPLKIRGKLAKSKSGRKETRTPKKKPRVFQASRPQRTRPATEHERAPNRRWACNSTDVRCILRLRRQAESF